jgi:exosortase/archaeosortase family protein
MLRPSVLLSPTPAGFCLRAVLLVLCLGLVGLSPPFEKLVEGPVMHADAVVTAKVLTLLGVPATTSGRDVTSPDFAVEVIPECTGVFVFLILAGVTLAFPATWRARAVGLLGGAAFIFILNEVRLVSLFFVGRANRELFHEVHLFVWQPIFVLVTAIYWYVWARRAIPGVGASATAPAGHR